MLLVGGGTLAFAAMLLRAGLSDLVTIDRFQVLDVISAPTLTRHAVVYRHEHAGSSSVAIGIWIVEGTAPDKGSRERPHGAPVAVWSEGFPMIAWQGDRLRLVGDRRPIVSDAARVTSCYFEGRSSDLRVDVDRSALCLDPARVTFVPLPR